MNNNYVTIVIHDPFAKTASSLYPICTCFLLPQNVCKCKCMYPPPLFSTHLNGCVNEKI